MQLWLICIRYVFSHVSSFDDYPNHIPSALSSPQSHNVLSPALSCCSEQKDDPDEVNLRAEMQQYGDIVRIDMVDTYADLSMKTLRMFSILPQKIDADFYFKVDDDVAVNVDALADYLEAHRTQGNLYMVSSQTQL